MPVRQVQSLQHTSTALLKVQFHQLPEQVHGGVVVERAGVPRSHDPIVAPGTPARMVRSTANCWNIGNALCSQPTSRANCAGAAGVAA